MASARTTAMAMLVLLASASASLPTSCDGEDWCTCAYEHQAGNNVCDASEPDGLCHFEGYYTDIRFGTGDTYITAIDLPPGEYACQHSGDCNGYCPAGNCCAGNTPPPLFATDPRPGATKQCSCKKGKPITNAGGDPITSFQGQEIRYWLSVEHFTPIFQQGPLVLSQLAGPANPPPGLEAHKGAWVVAMELDIAGLDKIRVEVVDPTTLLAHPNATAPPATDALTTMRLSSGGKLLAAGEHELSEAPLMTATVNAKSDPAKSKIGRGFLERIDIKVDGLHLRISSSKANKFADETLQVLGLHLDLDFVSFDETLVRGALPEMWGLQPMSATTKLLLDKEAAVHTHTRIAGRSL